MITKEIVQQFAQERIDERFPNVFIVAISISSSNAINIELDKKDGGVSMCCCFKKCRTQFG
jgi:hypothetical protein